MGNNISSFCNLLICYFMNRGNLKEYYETFLANRIDESFLYFHQSTRAYIAGLVAFKIYRETVSDSIWINRGDGCMNELKLWAVQGSDWNFDHKVQLMEAEHHFCSGNLMQATELYKKAIASARKHRSTIDEALACELAGEFFFEMGNFTTSLAYLRLAHQKYCEWGADGKATHLFSSISSKFALL